ncbi:hypothetical protein [Duganella sp. FT27W]|uniref:hypothetical protein n=1 Tax=Duganella sp. FT27W TaxID=2654636 RepID=UPI00128DD3E6|nr:hypothetical protein [Duganella sp. FT27W]MPQ56255.1 hypothetical protein [Duganella sp. FT27W]
MQIHLLPNTAAAVRLTHAAGDILIIESEKVIGVAANWQPFAITVEAGQLHAFPPRPLPQEVLTEFGASVVRAFGQAMLRGWATQPSVDLAMAKVQQLTCACCGSYHKGRQWWNRDDGYGLCNDCIDDCVTDPMDFLEAGASYGVPGYHYDIDGSHFRAKAGA